MKTLEKKKLNFPEEDATNMYLFEELVQDRNQANKQVAQNKWVPLPPPLPTPKRRAPVKRALAQSRVPASAQIETSDEVKSRRDRLERCVCKIK
jgi:hypothetical protein